MLVTPWLSTAVPFFALECAEMMRRAGEFPVILLDSTDIVQNASDSAHGFVLRGLIEKGFANWEVIPVTSASPARSPQDVDLAESIFRENAIWRSRGESRASEFMEQNAAARARIVQHLARVRSFIKSARIERLLIPGGIFGLSPLYVAMARELGISFATFDGGAGLLRLAQQGVAAHLADIPVAFQKLRASLDIEQFEKIQQQGRAELEDRTNARDFRQFQVSAATGRDDLRYDLFVPLNIRWDSAALGRQRAFSDVAAWLDALLTWVAARPGVTICLRQHPRERLSFAKGNDSLAPLLARHVALGERLRFVAAEESLNSYDLMRHARVVLPHTSTVGIEAAVLGLPVLLGAAVYYEDLGFCQKAKTSEEYFALLDQVLRGQHVPTAVQRDAAALAYFLTQRCAFMQTDFTAHPDDFRQWVQQPHEALWGKNEPADFRIAFLNGEPLALVRQRRLSDTGDLKTQNT